MYIFWRISHLAGRVSATAILSLSFSLRSSFSCYVLFSSMLRLSDVNIRSWMMDFFSLAECLLSF